MLILIVVLALAVFFPVAGRVIDKRDRAAEQAARRERIRRENVDRLLSRGTSMRLPRLSELPDNLLGVTATRYTMEGRDPYVPRGPADEEIRELLGAPGPPYPFAIVWGTTKTGKSRTLAEALRVTFAHDPCVVLPRDGQALAELCRYGLPDLMDQRPAVVMLDDLNAAGLEALTAEVLEAVRGWAVIAATMTAQRRAEVLTTGSSVTAIARAALAAVSGEVELTAEPPAGIQKEEAERLYPKERFDGSIAETLVGARELIARYKASYDTDPAGCAIVQAAIDIKRAGITRQVTGAELRRLFPLYLPAIRAGLIPTAEQFAKGTRRARGRPTSAQSTPTTAM